MYYSHLTPDQLFTLVSTLPFWAIVAPLYLPVIRNRLILNPSKIYSFGRYLTTSGKNAVGNRHLWFGSTVLHVWKSLLGLSSVPPPGLTYFCKACRDPSSLYPYS